MTALSERSPRLRAHRWPARDNDGAVRAVTAPVSDRRSGALTTE